jgi:hypothetical protein
LRSRVLVVGFGDTRVAEKHERYFFLLPIIVIWQQNCAKRKLLNCRDALSCRANVRLRDRRRP